MGPGGVRVSGDAVNDNVGGELGVDKPVKGPDKPVSSKKIETTTVDADPSVFTHPEGHKRKWVILRDTGNPHENKQPFVSLNGFAFKIQKNVPVHLPVPVIEMMKRCVFTKIERDDDGNEFTRDIPRYNIELVPQNEVPEG